MILNPDIIVPECRHFVTHCDHRYLPKALALHASLKRHHVSFILWIVCTSDKAEERVRALSDATLRPVPLHRIEDTYPQLLKAKANRSIVEYYYTLSPAVCRFILENQPCNGMVTYLDADMFFFSSPERVFELLGESSVGITPHCFSYWMRRMRNVGEYNVGWITFRKDANGTACLRWWFDRCIDWCYQRYEDGKYADQGYLNWFQKLFNGVKVLDDPGINLAQWNISNYRVQDENGAVKVDGKPLVFFHFADFVQLSKWHYSTNTSGALIWLTPSLRRLIFRPYIEMLRKITPEGLPRGLRKLTMGDLMSMRAWKEILRFLRKVFFMEYMFVFGDRIV
jgi:hypothetical protein